MFLVAERRRRKNPQKLCGQNISRKSLWPKCFWLPDKNVFHGNVVARQKCFQGKFVAKMFLVARQKCFPGKVGGQRKSVGRGKRFGQQASKHQILLFGFGFRHISKYCTQASLIKDLSVFFPASRWKRWLTDAYLPNYMISLSCLSVFIQDILQVYRERMFTYPFQGRISP